MKISSAVKQMIKKEFLEIRRSNLLRLLIAAPLLQVIVFGYVATTDIKRVQTVICDEDNSAQSRQLADKFLNSEYFRVVYFTREPGEIDRQLTANRAVIAIRIPDDFSTLIKKGKRAKVQVIVDGSDSNKSLISMNRAIMIITGYSQQVFAEKMEAMKKLAGDMPSVTLQERVWFNPELKSANTMVPGVIGFILMIVTLVITAVSIVREKESGNIEQVVVTPVKPWEIIIGKIVPYVIIGLVDIVLITVVAMLVFGLTFEGSFLLLLALSFVMILTNLGIGIFISTVSSTQQQAMLTAMFFAMPNILLSGFIFPVKNMPAILQAVTYIIPMRYFMVIIRGIFMKGLGFMELLPQTAALLLFGVVIFTLAIRQFKKTIG